MTNAIFYDEEGNEVGTFHAIEAHGWLPETLALDVRLNPDKWDNAARVDFRED